MPVYIGEIQADVVPTSGAPTARGAGQQPGRSLGGG